MSRISGSSYASKLMGRAGDGSTLSLDFTAMGGTLDPRITFTRASNATFINSSGYVEYAGANLFSYSEDFSNGSWLKSNATASTNATTAPDGNATADYMLETAGTSTRFFAKDSGAPGTSTEIRTFSVYVKILGRQWVSLCAGNTSGGPYYRITVDLSTGTISSTDLVNTGTWFTTTPTNSISPAGPAGSGWYRITITSRWCQYYLICPSDTASPSNSGSNFGLGFAYLGDTNSGVILWGAQLNPGSTAQTYYPTTTAAYYAPRFDYDPTTLAAKGLLIETGATNLCTYSNDFPNPAWTLDGVTNPVPSTVSQTGPDCAATVVRITFNKTGGAFSRIKRPISVSNGTYIMSVWMKANTANGAASTQNVGLRMGSSLGVNCVVTTTWQRFTHTYAVADGSAEFQIMIWDNIVANDETADVLVYGAQTELGSIESSYIPTGVAAVARAVDTAIIAAGTNCSSWYTGATSGTFVANWYGSAATSTARSVIATSDQTTKHLHMYQTPSALTLRLADFPVTTVTTANSLTANALARGAFSYASTATSLCLNGGTVATGTLAFTVAPTWLSIGGPSNDGTSITDTAVMLNNSIRTLKYFPTRLSNAQIQTLTTP